MQLEFRAIDEPWPAEKSRDRFARWWPSYRRWFLKEGPETRPSYLECRRALRAHMPELLPTYERLVELAGGGDMEARFLSLYRPTPYLTGCSQAVWTRGEPFLLRNYDYHPDLCEGALLHTAWNGRRVIAMADCFWGVLDGINEAGLAVSLSFGGRDVAGDGFGIPLLLRYVLETCESAPEAAETLRRVPSHMAYNVLLLDARGEYRTVFLGPDREPAVTGLPCAANHQEQVDWPRYARATASVERERAMREGLADPGLGGDGLVDLFARPPLYAAGLERGWTTLYTALYRPGGGEARYLWPGMQWTQSFHRFEENALSVSLSIPEEERGGGSPLPAELSR